MARTVTVEDVRHVAMLARLALTDQRARQLTADLNTILEHMDVLGHVDTNGVREASAHADPGMRLRPDKGPSAKLAALPEAFAPEMRDGFFIVPRLSTHEGDADPSIETTDPS
jgi:aspartyl-tRNA(Asn)/glutamyl-tRNA(Gln) amidotransferase subunit C